MVPGNEVYDLVLRYSSEIEHILGYCTFVIDHNLDLGEAETFRHPLNPVYVISDLYA